MTGEYDMVRKQLVELIKKEMVGPGSEKPGESGMDEVISESPLQRYSMGILYPVETEMETPEEENDRDTDELELKNLEYRIFENDQEITQKSENPEESRTEDNLINTANQYYPSAMGLSFMVETENPEFVVDVSAGTYRKLDPLECTVPMETLPDEVEFSASFRSCLEWKDNKLIPLKKITPKEKKSLMNLTEHQGFKNAVSKIETLQRNGWKRSPINKPIDVKSENFSENNPYSKEVFENSSFYLQAKLRKIGTNKKLVTVSLINRNKCAKEERTLKIIKSFFQVEFTVYPGKNTEFKEYELYNVLSNDEEDKSNSLLYRNKKSFAVGHGCSPEWEIDGDMVKCIKAETMPSEQIKPANFKVKELDGEEQFVLSMKHLSDESPWTDEQIFSHLRKFTTYYKDWIDGLEEKVGQVDPNLRETAKRHIEKCRNAYDRMNAGIDTLEIENDVLKAFKLANKAMLMQRAHTIMQSQKKWPDQGLDFPNYNDIKVENASWRPFQLAYLLLNIKGIYQNDHPDRDIVDLIWFPTGGGKTEAYLGVSAFTIFLRRLMHKENGGGTTILMRYTLRLLTAQQFQRAGTLICACEKIRRSHKELGEEIISIGLWIGSSSTPNKIDQAKSQLTKLVSNKEQKNPFQILSCPWCGTRLYKQKGKGEWGYDVKKAPKRFSVFCTNHSCHFHEELPIKVVDEDIYNDPPTLLFGTVDKFALMPWDGSISSIFALNEGNKNLSPELIIQDELHLISGPLGTMVGIYETALDAMCSHKGKKPKIIASTATIRHSSEQSKALYNREVSQFPPSGLTAEDSFFAKEDSENPGRLYVGAFATGKTLTTTEVRLMAAILHYITEIDCDDEIKDAYWTLVGYFNSIRELGKAKTLFQADISEQVYRIATRRGVKNRVFGEAEELTSRKEAEEIPEILEKMEVAYPEKNALSVLLATNMISVGVDVDRLGLMTVTSQPKTTSEYIQATSRVGRKYPGLIFTLYDGVRPRDRSHYEKFKAYHQSFYKYVEPTSVTPFSSPARERALHAVLVSMVRHIYGLKKDGDAGKFKADSKETEKFIDFIVERVLSVMPEEADSCKKDLEERIQLWSERGSLDFSDSGLWFGSNTRKDNRLLKSYKFKHDKNALWPTLQSMRNVSEECTLKIED